MDPDPNAVVEEDAEEKKSHPPTEVKRSKANLNTLVAISVALLATFLGICKVKDDNIVQAMQQLRPIRLTTIHGTRRVTFARGGAFDGGAIDCAGSRGATPGPGCYQEQIKTYKALAQDQAEKKKIQQADAEKADKTYNELNTHDDQFDLSDVMMALAISLLAMTALTQKRWLYVSQCFRRCLASSWAWPDCLLEASS